MTPDDEKTIQMFESRVRQLMQVYSRLKHENEQLTDKVASLEAKLGDAEEEIAKREKAYSLLKSARILEVSGDHVKETRARLSRLIREVDKCISLLNV